MKYDANRIASWTRQLTGGNLIPPKGATKTRAQQKQEAAERELDKYDLQKQQEEQYEQDKESGLLSKPSSSCVLPSWKPSAFYPKTAMGMGSYLQFMSYPLISDEEVEASKRREEEIRHQKLKALSDQLDAVARASLVKVPEPETPKDIRIPDYTSCILGWRGWRVSNGKLSALGINAPWIPKIAVPAECRVSTLSMFYTSMHDDEAPHMKCSCGYWAFDSREKITQALEPYLSTVEVIGTVHLWGKIIKCENGYRAQYAYPAELWLLRPGLDYLSWTYGVPVRRIS